MGYQSWTVWVVWCAIATWVLQMGECSPSPDHHEAGVAHMPPQKTKLLYIMMDGFRWDYIDKQSESALPGFTKFLNKGVRARWTNPLYPSVSYPSWTSLSTGQYVETHNLVGNYFYDAETKEVFSLSDPETTRKPKWWTTSEPIWTTAEKAGLVTAQYQWARCDVPIDGITTHYCIPYNIALGKDLFLEYIMKALQKFNEGYDFVQVYTEHTDHTGHVYGPDSEEVLQAVRDLDDVINILMTELEERQLINHVNIVIVSDHGMANTAPGVTQRHEIDSYLDTSLVENIADRGPLMNIKVPQENIQKVYDQLSRIPGVRVYKKEDIPEHLHYKKGKYVHEILVIADEGTLVMGSNTEKQLPARSDGLSMGSHGYSSDVQSMKGIFFARGPAFREGVDIDPILMVDVYQVLTNVLELTPQPHNGTWENVKLAFRNSEQDNGASTFLTSSILLFFSFTLIRCL